MAARVLEAVRAVFGRKLLGYPALVVLGLAWTIVGTLAFARHYLADAGGHSDGGLLLGYAEGLTCYLPWTLLSAIVLELERRLPLVRSGWPRSLGLLALASVPVVYLAWLMTLGLELGVQLLFGLPLKWPQLTWIIPARELLGHQFLYWFSVAASGMIRTLLESRENERRAARLMLEKSQLESSLRQTELDALRMRLHPHFLFNSLQNISVLTEHDPQTGSRMLTKLGELLRASLGRDSRPETTLQAEIELTNAYLAIERMRFGDRLSSFVDIAPGTERALVPTFLLQPIVENAIRHGLRNVCEGGLIGIRSRLDADALVLTVTDNGAGPPGAGFSELPLGIGLGATCERLSRLYPGRHSFSMHAVPEGGTEVRITVPLRFGAAREEPEVACAALADR